MIILIDIDNDSIKWSLYHKEQITPQKPIPYNLADFKAGINQLLTVWTSKNIDPHRILVSSIANMEVSAGLNEALNQAYELEIENLVASKSYKSLKNSYNRANTLEINRWLKLIGAYEFADHHTSNYAYCVIDCDAAITIDAVDKSGKHLGGFITPGLELMERSLLALSTPMAQLGEKSLISKINKLKKPTNANGFLANNTKHAVVGGIYYLTISYIENIIADLDYIFNSEFKVFITGTHASQVMPMLNSNHYENLLDMELKEDLVWQGMISLI